MLIFLCQNWLAQVISSEYLEVTVEYQYWSVTWNKLAELWLLCTYKLVDQALFSCFHLLKRRWYVWAHQDLFQICT